MCFGCVYIPLAVFCAAWYSGLNGLGCVVEVRDVWKIYPDGTIALRGVSLCFRSGEVHVLLGENGAGKTTLARIVYGEIKPSRGLVLVDGVPRVFRGPWEAARLGIAMVYQHFSLVHRFSVLENLVLYGSRLGLSPSEVVERVREITESYGLRIPLGKVVAELPASIQQRVELVKALLARPRLLILDEPTSLVSSVEVEAVYRLVRRLRDEGVSIVYITHKLREVGVVGDRVTVLRRGRIVASFEDARRVSVDELAKLMVGGLGGVTAPSSATVLGSSPHPSRRRGRCVLKAIDIWVRVSGVDRVRGVSLEVYSGEVLGIAGVAGNGQDELVEVLVGLRQPYMGRVYLLGRDVTRLGLGDRVKLGLAFLPGSRRLSLVHDMSLIENLCLSLAVAGKVGWIVNWSSLLRVFRDYASTFKLVYRDAWQPVRLLSGGNQQKLALLKILALQPKVLVAVEPTYGLDVASTRLVRSIIRSLASSGVGVLVVSTDLDELMEVCDRIAVMYAGRIVAVRSSSEYSREELGRLMGGVVED